MKMAAAFGGTTQKCKACDKTVYFVDQLTADSRVYHKSCFRCHHCKGTLKFSNYNSFEGVLYCKPHYDQLFKMTGSLDKSFEGSPRSAKVDRSIVQENHATSRLSSMFTGTQDKCVVCKKTVYPIEKVAVDGSSYHKACFRCSYGGCVISLSSYNAHEGKLYCKHHHTQLFMARGDFRQLEEKHEDTQLFMARGDFRQLEEKHEDTHLFMARGDFRQLEEKHEDTAKVPSEIPITTGDSKQLEDKHVDTTNIPSENPMNTEDSRPLEEKHEDVKILSESSIANGGVEESVGEGR